MLVEKSVEVESEEGWKDAEGIKEACVKWWGVIAQWHCAVVTQEEENEIVIISQWHTDMCNFFKHTKNRNSHT